jgi:hypothetical protein
MKVSMVELLRRGNVRQIRRAQEVSTSSGTPFIRVLLLAPSELSLKKSERPSGTRKLPDLVERRLLNKQISAEGAAKR